MYLYQSNMDTGASLHRSGDQHYCVSLMNICFNVKENSSVRRIMNTNKIILRSPVQCNVVGQNETQVVELLEWE